MWSGSRCSRWPPSSSDRSYVWTVCKILRVGIYAWAWVCARVRVRLLGSRTSAQQTCTCMPLCPEQTRRLHVGRQGCGGRG